MSICSRLVNLMGGRIWVESREGEGSQFHFTVRVGRRPSGITDRLHRTGAPRMDQLAGVRVLIVDDNAVNRRILNEACTSWGMQPDPADSGIVGITLLRRARAAGAPYRLVLLDAQMPEMDGFEMARRIREDTDLSGVMVMMLSSCDLTNDAQRCRELGISRYLIKPVMQADLLNAILITLGLVEESPEPLTGSPLPFADEVLAGRRVLVAEDHPVNRKLVSKMLEKRSLVPVLATNGDEVLRALESDTFDLILMDVQMPGMDGLQTTVSESWKRRPAATSPSSP